MISQIFVLSSRGDTLLSRQYRGDVVRGTEAMFWRRFTRFGAALRPVFCIDSTSFCFLRKSGLLFVCTTKFNASPVLALELLARFAAVIRDYTGVLSEEAIRKNAILIYELWDELVDYGHVQDTSTEHLRACCHTAPKAAFGTAAAAPAAQSLADVARSDDVLGSFKRLLVSKLAANNAAARGLAPASAAAKSVADSASRRGGGLAGSGANEIFVDLVERLTALFTRDGEVVRSEIDGRLQLRSFLDGAPLVTLALNEDLAIGRRSGDGGLVVVDDIAFHEAANLERFEDARVLTLVPPDGEATLLTYRVTGEFRIPFRVFAFVDELSADRFTVSLRVRADVPPNTFGKGVRLTVPMPRGTASCSFALPHGSRGQTATFVRAENHIEWFAPRVPGGTEVSLVVTAVLDAGAASSWRSEVGPVAMAFEVPQHSFSGLTVRSLKIADRYVTSADAEPPKRWVRFIASSDSYVCRV